MVGNGLEVYDYKICCNWIRKGQKWHENSEAGDKKYTVSSLLCYKKRQSCLLYMMFVLQQQSSSLFFLDILMRECCRLWCALLTTTGTRVMCGSTLVSGGALHYTTIWNMESTHWWGMCSEDALWSIKGAISVWGSGIIRLLFHPCSFQKPTPFRRRICLLWGGDVQRFQTQADSSEAVIWASSSQLVMNLI